MVPNSYWQWTSPWIVDTSGHVDGDGWEVRLFLLFFFFLFDATKPEPFLPALFTVRH